MLDPGERHLLTDALRPPSGFSVDAALATTYTVDLNSVLLAPLAMAAYDHADSTVDAATPVALLESIRRHAEHTTVLCQAGGMHVPPTYPRLAAFAEGMVAEVEPPPGRTFHPKLWLLRFTGPEGDYVHRFVCMSRNLTGDRSWDTVLVCDEDADASHTFDAGPIATWVTDLLGSLVRPLPRRRDQAVRDLCHGFESARLAVPEPFTSAVPVPLGTAGSSGWPLPSTAKAWVVVSPFLESSALTRLPQATGRRIVLSRPDAFDRVGRRVCNGAETVVLQSMTDLATPEEAIDDATGPETDAGRGRGGVPRGLHAKLFVWDDGQGISHVITGSANCTGAAFGGNVEMSVRLSGPTSSCGVDVLLGDDKTGLLRITQPHHIAEDEPTVDPTYALERRVEEWHVTLAASRPVLRVAARGEAYSLGLEIEVPPDPLGLAVTTVVKPAAVPNAPSRPIAEAASWEGVSLHALSPYLVVTSDAQVDGAVVRRSCVIVCEVEGAPEDRHRRLLRVLLSRQQDVLRYLMLLLGDLGADDLLDQLTNADGSDTERASGSFGRGLEDLVLLEPLMRAAARGDDALARAQRLLEDLRDDEGKLPQLDADFQQIWRAVWEGGQR
ncbi:phospholipase D family protein [Mumia sp. zg.B21]|uniref:phospholipase D family protein n=1 Tax=Mumia sp. zg.B21 TaxID=2855447 RepID=UPI001C6E5ED1|nr:phospholipase D family protein [Mumia sp. zg.B21]MBW9208628.1 phospholipase D family protein [Mumia sp. zg.B21]